MMYSTVPYCTMWRMHEWNNLFGGLLPPSHNVQCLGKRWSRVRFLSQQQLSESLKLFGWLIIVIKSVTCLLCNASSSMIDDDPKSKQTDTPARNHQQLNFFNVEPHKNQQTTYNIQKETLWLNSIQSFDLQIVTLINHQSCPFNTDWQLSFTYITVETS